MGHEEVRRVYNLVAKEGPCVHEEWRSAGYRGATCAACNRFFEAEEDLFDSARRANKWHEEVSDFFFNNTHQPKEE